MQTVDGRRMHWFLDPLALALVGWIGTAATLIGLMLTWLQARAAHRSARAAQSAAEASRSATERAIAKVRERIHLADVGQALSDLRTIRALVHEASYSNLIHIANAYRENLMTAVLTAARARAGTGDMDGIVANLQGVWRFIEIAGKDGMPARHRTDVLDRIAAVEAFLTEYSHQKRFEIASEVSDGR